MGFKYQEHWINSQEPQSNSFALEIHDHGEMATGNVKLYYITIKFYYGDFIMRVTIQQHAISPGIQWYHQNWNALINLYLINV